MPPCLGCPGPAPCLPLPLHATVREAGTPAGKCFPFIEQGIVFSGNAHLRVAAGPSWMRWIKSTAGGRQWDSTVNQPHSSSSHDVTSEKLDRCFWRYLKIFQLFLVTHRRDFTRGGQLWPATLLKVTLNKSSEEQFWVSLHMDLHYALFKNILAISHVPSKLADLRRSKKTVETC